MRSGSGSEPVRTIKNLILISIKYKTNCTPYRANFQELECLEPLQQAENEWVQAQMGAGGQ
jgi:hypothetical protein